ncbi:hypothetical protein FLK61_27845 [Paenalkalicoccus suaedae]|uniref:Uncharacterized protein n=1 Tax=Paenalkalicoccus suaedae TaxID=2592382 RepID=A0A859FEB3_9BACI|nr:hypothetical protein [Paenalkalicoccus suaedae]QKS70566.1 hypothetical protein FLK61_27845 [Paenalkalicoccus suaedae]
MSQNTTKIVPLVDLDTSIVETYINEWTRNDTYSMSYFSRGMKSPQPKAQLAILEDEQPKGFLIAWTSSIHPACTYVSIISSENEHTYIKALLIEELRRNDGVRFPLQTTVLEEEYEIVNFYRSRQFTVLRKTYLPSLAIKEVKSTNSFHIKNGMIDLTSIANNKDLREQLVILVKDCYERAHLGNQVAALTLDQWEDLIFSSDLIKTGSFIYVDELGVRSFAMLHEGDIDASYELGWRGARDTTYIRDIEELTQAQIEIAYQHGVDVLEAEIDTTDPYAMHMLSAFAFENRETLVTFQLKQRKSIKVE